MRDPKRIPEILIRLRNVWFKHPDMRLGQLIENVFPNVPKGTSIPAYYIEDEEFIKTIEDFYRSEPIFRRGGEQDLKNLLEEIKKP